MKAAERRQAILEALCERRKDTIENLAFEFGVSRRTIVTDIQELSISYPIDTVCGRYGGGVYIAEGYYLGKQYLNEEQVKLLKEIDELLDENKQRVLRSILNKFSRPNTKKGGD